MSIVVNEINFPENQQHSVFAFESYLKSISPYFNWLGGFIDGELVCLLPFIRKHRKVAGFKIFTTVQFQTATIYIKEIPVEIEEKYLEMAVVFLKKSGVDFIMQPPAYSIFRTIPPLATSTQFGTYRINLRNSEDELWQNLHQKHRNVIRNAMKNDVEILEGLQYSDMAYELVKETMDRSEMNFISKDNFLSLISDLKENLKIFVTLHDGKIQGCAVLPYSKYAAYYLYGGSIREPVLGSINLMHWNAIQYFKNQNVLWYDFVGARLNPIPGSKLEGIQRFKSRFGSELQQGYLWKAILKPKKYVLYKMVQNWLNPANKEVRDIIDQENNSSNF